MTHTRLGRIGGGLAAVSLPLSFFLAPTPALAMQAAAIAPPEGVTQVASVEGITEYRLDNGLRVLLFPDQSKQQITVNITYLVGSRHEGYGETGMAHLLEHLVFKGTPDHPDIPQELTEHGAFPNGTTWFDRTNYFETFPATAENLEWALDLEADRMVNSFISDEDLDSEMTVVRNEWESGENSPFGVLLKRTLSTAFEWHNYGNSTIGARADIENVPIGRLQAFYRKYYQPDNAVLVVAGRFEPESALELIAAKFGAIPRPERTGAMEIYPTYTAEPAQDGERHVTLRRVGDTQIVMVVYHVPPGSHEQFAAIDVLTHILDTEPAGRLYQQLVEPGLAASADAFNFQLMEPGALILYANVRTQDSLDEAQAALLAAIDSLRAAPPSEQEVERAKTEFLKNIELAFNNPQGIALQLSEWAAMGDWRLFFLHRDRLESVTAHDVHQAAQAYLVAANGTIGTFHPVERTPQRAEMPAAPDVEALVADYAGREAVAAGEAFEPTPANIEERTQRFTFGDGFELALMPKENRGEAVTVSFAFRFGTEDALRGKSIAAELAASMLRRGTERLSRQEIEDELDRLKAQLFFGGDATLLSGQVQTVREHLPDVLRLLAEMLTQPAFDAAEFETLKEETLAALENQLAEPQPRAIRALQRHLDPWPEGHPEYVPTLEEEIEEVRVATLEEARAFWEGFYGAQGGTMAIVGDHDPDEIRAVIEELFGTWTSEQPYVRFDRPYREVEATRVEIETPDKANAVMFAAQPLNLGDDDPDYPALELGNYMIGGGFLNSRLATRIRQEEGLSYGVGSSVSAHPIDERGQFFAYAIYAPENAEAVVAAFRDVLETVLRDGFTAEEVAAAKRGYLDSRQNARANDGSVAGTLNSGLFFDRTMEFTAEQEAAIEALTPDDIREVLARYLDPSKISIFLAGDFANAKATS
ncbi:MAG: M16 family metallopeptidase [Gemmatimonadota bacterium]